MRRRGRPTSGRAAPAEGAKKGRARVASEGGASVVPLLGDLVGHHETSPVLTGGDLDADWQQAHLSGEEAVGGSVATPDQDVVDEIARALGVELPTDAEVESLDELLRRRDRDRWRLEEEAAAEAEGRRR